MWRNLSLPSKKVQANKRRPFNKADPKRTPSDVLRNPRKCPNCGEAQPERICPKPAVAIADRKCWTCRKTGHSSAQCPSHKAPGGLKAVTDGRVLDAVENAFRLRRMFLRDHYVMFIATTITI